MSEQVIKQAGKVLESPEAVARLEGMVAGYSVGYEARKAEEKEESGNAEPVHHGERGG